tara:strand:+ start:86 stop:448 length:363 start_codon:yes stop_codon:yes gene_type:complete
MYNGVSIMKTVKLYHGTTTTNINNLLDCPKATACINGNGFYVSLDIEVAKQYGSSVVCWEVEAGLLNIAQRPIDQRYQEGLMTYEECALGGMEIVLTQTQADAMAIECYDAYLLTRERSL